MEYTLGSLFSGSGGFELAGSLCGVKPVWASEVEPYPIAVTKSRFPFMLHYGDVSKINGANIIPVDIISAGSPCQNLSVSGKREGIKHISNGDEETTRSGLFMETIRIVKEMREATGGKFPKYVLWENVPGAFSSNKGEDFRLVLEEYIKIAEPNAVMPEVPKGGWSHADCYIGDGWSLAYRVLNSEHIRTAQRRRRIYLVLDLTGVRAGEILFKRESLQWNPEKSGGAWKDFTGSIEDGIGTADQEIERIAYSIENHPHDSRVSIDPAGKVQTLTGRMGTGGGNVPLVVESKVYESHPQDSRIKELDNVSPAVTVKWHKGTADTPLVCSKIEDVSSYEIGNGQTNQSLMEEVCGTLNCMHDQRAVMQPRHITEPNCPPGVAYEYIVRRLTPIECARLQGFPDRWGEIDHKDDMSDEEYSFWLDVRNTHAKMNNKDQKEYSKKQILAWYNKLHTDSAEYKMWGNGIALPCAVYCMEGIVEALNNQSTVLSKENTNE